MNQYKNQFGATRIPGKPADTLVTPFPSTSKHIIVMAKNILYQVPVVTSY